MERSTIFNGKIHYKWPFSIATLVYQRVQVSINQRWSHSRPRVPPKMRASRWSQESHGMMGLQNGSFKGTQRFNGIYNMSHDIILYSHGISHIISATILYMVALQILYSHGDRGTYDMRYLNFMRFNGIYNMDDIAFYPRFFNRKNETTWETIYSILGAGQSLVDMDWSWHISYKCHQLDATYHHERIKKLWGRLVLET